MDEVTPWKMGADEKLLLRDRSLWIEVTPWKVGADEKLLLRDRSLWMRLLLGKWVLTRSCYSETGLCG